VHDLYGGEREGKVISKDAAVFPRECLIIIHHLGAPIEASREPGREKGYKS
jgi:hypothetical protein